MDRQRGIQSLDHAMKLLKILSEVRGAISLSELARRADMPASKAHRYLASFTSAGLAVKQPKSGQYGLGPFALDLGLAAMDQLDLVNQAADEMSELVTETGATVLLAIWGTYGPTVIRWERSSSMIATSLGLGSTLPLLNSASGRVFLTFLPESVTKSVLDREIAARKRGSLEDIDITRAGLAGLVNTIREAGYATVDNQYIPGLSAASAPITNWQGEVAAAVTLISHGSGLLETKSPAVAQLLEFCRKHSTTTVRSSSAD